MQMDVRAGVGYGIVVDGFAGNFGTFEITISATKVLSAALTASPVARRVLTRTFTRTGFVLPVGRDFELWCPLLPTSALTL